MADADSLSNDVTHPPRVWPIPLRILFRFVFAYLMLNELSAFRKLAPWVATYFFHIKGQTATYFKTGSGDTTLSYINALLCLIAAGLIIIPWSVFDRRRPNYITLHGWLRIMVRYTLAFTLFSYGFSKVFPLQFPPNGLFRLMEPYGQFSPMGVVWSFMGASQPYTVFSGAAEVTGGLLLLFRRTTTLGAMVSFAVLLNVVALNFCYDIPVKLFSIHLLLKTVFLIIPDARRLFNVLVLNRPSEPVDLNIATFQRRSLQIASRVLWAGIVAADLFNHIWGSYQRFIMLPQKSPIYGLYRVENGGDSHWQKVAFENLDQAVVLSTDDTTGWAVIDYDLSNSAVIFKWNNENSRLVWSRPDPLHLDLTGNLYGKQVTIKMRRIDGELLLPNRGFHWISEFPFNR